jgi:hypothetical protein
VRERVWNGEMPKRMQRLPRDRRGFPVPYFVAWDGDEPVFPAMDPKKLYDCVRFSQCWVCGERLGAHKAFLIGPMCVCNRVTAEPPSHLDCARWSAMNCPFLVNPRQKRIITQDGTKLDIPHNAPAGIMIERNPGVSAIWVTKSFAIEKEPGGLLFRLGDFETISFWAKGRPATREEVEESVKGGLPILRAAAEKDGPQGLREFDRAVSRMVAIFDAFPWPIAPDVDVADLYGEAG